MPPGYSSYSWWKLYSKPSHCLICVACVSVLDSMGYLWNPATREVKILPHNIRPYLPNTYGESRMKLAFGYSKINDYNLVKDFIVAKVLVYRTREDTVGSNWSKCSVMVDVYSLSSNSWKSVEVKEDYVVRLLSRTAESNLALINGVIYCWNEKRIIGEKKLAGFNIENEITREIVLPGEFVGNDFVIQDFNESVSLLVKVSSFVEMWVLEDDKENGIWRKNVNVNLERLYAWPPLGIFRSNGKLVLKTSDWSLGFRLVSCIGETGEKMDIFDLEDCLCLDSCKRDVYVFKHVVFYG